MSKVHSLQSLIRAVDEQRRLGKRIVQSHGTFDLLHTGHIRHLQKAAEQGDILVVTITADAYVNKGPERPVFKETLRAENVAALECVDFVYVNPAITAEILVSDLQPDVYAKGGEYLDEDADVTGNITRERKVVERFGGKMFYSDEITFSSTKLLNDYFDIFNESVRGYLLDFKQRYAKDKLEKLLQSISSLKVLVIGDAILDEYQYTRPLGMTGKSNALGVRFLGEEQFAGGAAAVANHVAGLAGQVTLVTGIGRDKGHERFFKEHLLDNVSPVFFPLTDGTVTKRRYVDSAMNHLFEVYSGSHEDIDEAVELDVCGWIKSYASEHDVVIIPDYGNGFISSSMVETLCSSNSFVAVNTQVNGMNRGFHVVTRYSRGDFISLNEPELRMAARDQHGPLEKAVFKVAQELNAANVAVTRGKDGLMWFDINDNRTIQVPALSTKVIDRIGAGDAFLAIAGVCLGKGLPSEVAAFTGACAAALDVQIVCNKEPVSKHSLLKYITTLLK